MYHWKCIDKLFFLGPASLGDSFVYNGLVHYYADRCNELHLPINQNYVDTLEPLYSDFKNIKTVCFPPDPSTYALEDEYCGIHGLSRILRPPIYGSLDPVSNEVYIPYLWDQQIYAFFEIPYSVRYTHFRLPKEVTGSVDLFTQLVAENEPYILVHRGTGNYPDGININVAHFRKEEGLPDYRVIDITTPLTKNMLDYLHLIIGAKEIHCVPNSMFCFVDNISTKIKANLFLHNVKKSTVIMSTHPWNNCRWTNVHYNEKAD